MQIENQKHVKDIDERNKKLLALKLNSGKTVQTLNSLKKKLQDATRDQDMISSDMKIKQDKQSKTTYAIQRTKQEIEKINIVNRKQQGLKELMKDMPNPIKFVEQKNQCQELVNCVKNWERKIEIAEVAAKKASQVIRNNGGFINQMNMGDMGEMAAYDN